MIIQRKVRFMKLNETLTYFRTQKGYSVNKLANLAGIAQSYLRDLELGNKNPTVEVLSYICDALQISLADFFYMYCKQESTMCSLEAEIARLSVYQRKLLEEFLHAMLANESMEK